LTAENNTSRSGFEVLGITGQLLRAANAAGFVEPKPIQEKAIPAQLAGRDILGIAQTGSGKTAAFALPILKRILALHDKRKPRTARALVLAPTRELAVQIEDTFKALSKGTHVATALVLGGVSRGTQVKKLSLGVDILVATPGRLTDLVRERDLNLSETTWLVLDEADRMLDMGFINDVRRIAKATHPARQTALFSATMPDEIAELAGSLLRDPVRVDVAPQGTPAAEIKQSVIIARTKQKRDLLTKMLADPAMRSVLIFARTKHGADRVAKDLDRDGIEAAVIHGNKSQNARQKALNGFRDGSMRILVATDIAARGIDVPGITHVINFDLPDEAESYVHRIGRTGRNGADGIAITLCDPSEGVKLRAVEKIMRVKLPVVADHSGAPPLEAEKRAAQSAGDRNEPGRAANGNRGGRNAQQRPAGNRDWVGRGGPGKKADVVAKPAANAAADGDKAAGKPKRRFRPKRNFGNRGAKRAA